MFQAFSWAKNTARGVRFLLRFNMHLFLAQSEQVYLILALARTIMTACHLPLVASINRFPTYTTRPPKYDRIYMYEVRQSGPWYDRAYSIHRQ